MASAIAQYELAALLQQRQEAHAEGFSPYPSIEQSFHALPGLQAGLDQALGMLDLIKEYPELAAHINPGGLPNEEQ